MVIADFSGDYLNAENAHDGDIAEIRMEGEYVDITMDGNTRKVLNLPVLLNGKTKVYSPSRETGKKFVKAWGADTKNWVGKKFQIKIVAYKSFGQTKQGVEGEPVEVKK